MLAPSPRGPRLAVAALVALAAVSTVTASAHACFNVTQAEVDAQTRKVKAAAAALDAEDHAAARKIAKEAIHFLETSRHARHPDGKLRSPQNTPVEPPDPSLLVRAYRVDALAQSRAAKSAQGWEEASTTFEQKVLGGQPDPTVLADWAEVMSHLPARAGQATMMLRSLREKDLLGSPHAWVALARLEKAAADPAAEKAARERCRTAALKKAICDA